MTRFSLTPLAAGVWAAIVLSPAVRVGAAAQVGVREPAQVTIVGNDYAFVAVPDTVAAGKTLLSFENRGKVRHEMSVTLFKPGATVEQALQLGFPAAQRLMDRIIGILVVKPGDTSGGQLYVELQPGRRYMLVCTLKDQPDAQPHVQLGMIASFVVR